MLNAERLWLALCSIQISLVASLALSVVWGIPVPPRVAFPVAAIIGCIVWAFAPKIWRWMFGDDG
jgi:hypothetical protein